MRCLVQNIGRCDANAEQSAKIRNCRIGTGERSAEGGLQCTLHFRGPQKIGGQISDIFRTPCFAVLDVQDVRNTISDNFRVLPKVFRKFPHRGGGAAGVRFGRHA